MSLLEWRGCQEVETCRRSESSGGQQGRDATRVACERGYEIEARRSQNTRGSRSSMSAGHAPPAAPGARRR
jgi:hypothetical protein